MRDATAVAVRVAVSECYSSATLFAFVDMRESCADGSVRKCSTTAHSSISMNRRLRSYWQCMLVRQLVDSTYSLKKIAEEQENDTIYTQ
jgi:hypothetical protein